MKSKKQKSSLIFLIPILFALAIIPLIVKFIGFDPQLSSYSWYTNTTQFFDVFMYYKHDAMLLLDGMLVIGFIWLFFKKQLPKEKAFLPLAIYLTLVLLSSFVSVSSYHTWHGFPDMMESTFVLFGYGMICYYAYAVIKTEQQLKIVFFTFFIGIFFLCLIGFFQFIGKDPFLTEFGKNILFTGEYAQYRDTIQRTFEEGRVSITLYNPNYVGVYCCIVIPILLMLLFTIKQKKYVILYLILLGLAFSCFVGSGSKTAVITLIPCVIFMVFYFGRRLGKKMIVIVAGVVIAFVALNVYQGENSVFMKVISRFEAGYTPDKEYALKDITLYDEYFSIVYKDTVIKVNYIKTENGYDLEVKDENNIILSVVVSEEDGKYYFEDVFFDELAFQKLNVGNQQVGYVISSENCNFNICYSPTDETYYYLNLYGRYTKLYDSELFDIPIFHLMGGFSGRDFIWGKSIPILKETIFLGSGPDTYSFMFPQYDYVASAQNGFGSQTITKPHNTYLQIGIQTGVLSLLAYLVFYGIYFVQSAKIYLKRNLLTFTERCGAGIFIASVCYMIAGLINDSTIGVSVIFWTLLGVGYACNHAIKQMELLQNKEYEEKEIDEKEDSDNLEKKRNIKYYLVIFGGIIFISLVGHYSSHWNDSEPTNGRAKFETSAIGYQQEETIPYNAVMNVEWTFTDGLAISSDAYVENSTENQNDMYFDVKLDNGECIYTSEIIHVGERLETIRLEHDLEAGNYSAIVTYHLLDSNKNEVATAEIGILIKVLN
ncbi:MAG: O-antigen ligase family protein [Lachnospiraceae bacterium]|nr:O-antigen ligase family protein [Lachnospiraceae bacterium]